MHLGTNALLRFHARHRDDGALVLATIVATEGSTYRKPGAMMLISRGGDYEGLISGGCLEGDLLEHAAVVFESGEPKEVTYDMHADEDIVWGLGIGCDGLIRLLLQRLEGDFHRALFDGMARALSGRRRVLLALATESSEGGWPKAAIATVDEAGTACGDRRLADLIRGRLVNGWPGFRYERVEDEAHNLMLINLTPVPRVLLCGGGPDAVPAACQFAGLGWECVIADHRQAFARADRFPPGVEVVLGSPGNLSEHVDLSAIDAAVVMSHHLENDAAYLRRLAPLAEAGSLKYLGVLGPAARRKRLADMADCTGVLIHGPVGLDIGAELPESIALSLAAEIHAALNHRDGQSLTRRVP